MLHHAAKLAEPVGGEPLAVLVLGVHFIHPDLHDPQRDRSNKDQMYVVGHIDGNVFRVEGFAGISHHPDLRGQPCADLFIRLVQVYLVIVVVPEPAVVAEPRLGIYKVLDERMHAVPHEAAARAQIVSFFFRAVL